MSKLVTSDNLKAYHSELAEHLQLLERDKVYLVGDIAKYDGLTLKCTIAGNTDVNKVDYSSIDVGDTIVDGTVTFTVIDPNSMWYEENKFYMVDDIVVYDDKFYKCITAHTATAIFDTTKWAELSTGGGVDLPEWQANTAYTAGKYLVHEGTVYKVTTNFTSGTTFDDTNLSAYIAPVMTGASSSNDGKSGIVPQPTINDISKFLCGDGTWKSASSVPIISDILWSGTCNSVSAGDTITMSNNYTDYDEIVLIGDGQLFRSLVPSLGSAIAYDNDGGSFGSTFAQHFIITFSGNTCNAITWWYGSSVVSSTMCIVGIKRTVTTGAYIGKSLLWSGTHLDISSVASITLADDVKDYDSIIFTLGFGIASEYIEIDDSSNVLTFFMESYIGDSANHIKFSGWCDHTTLNFINKQFGTQFTSSNPCSIFIWGLKYIPNPNNYSTTEKEIGTWIDGKKLYQKTLTGTTPNTVGAEVTIATISGMETMVSIDGFIRDSYSNFIPVYYSNNGNISANDYIYIFTNSTGDIIFKAGSSGYANKYFAITVKYTKV